MADATEERQEIKSQSDSVSWLYLVAACVVAAVLQISSFPTIGWSVLAFVCWVPLLILVPHRSVWKLFGYFFLSGVIFQIGNLYWIIHVIQHYSALSTTLSIGVVLLLCVAIALLCWGPFGAVLGLVCRRSGFLAAMLVAPFLWVLLEWLRCVLTHFPWCFLGYSQYKNLRIAQTASFFGVYGLSCLLMGFNASVACWWRTRKYTYPGIVVGLLALFSLYGHFRIQVPVGKETATIGCIQGNIPQDVKLSYEFAEDVNRLHLDMSEKLIRQYHPTLIFWPEASTLFPIRNGSLWSQQILDLAKKNQTALIVGSDTYIDDQVWNSAYYINRQGIIEGYYSKIYLVPFGEFVPFRSILIFVDKVVPEISDFSPGTRYEPFSHDGKKFGVQICFEVVFPQLTRESCRRGAGLLATITNDAWFGDTAAPYQHFSMAIMRAIETRRYLVRAANTGISGFVDPYGRVLQATKIFEPAIISGQIRWVEEQTFYTKFGDILVSLSALVCMAILIRAFVKGRNQKPRLETTDGHR